MASWRESTKKQYLPYINKWISFCTRNKTPLYAPSVGNVLDYLTELFHAGLGYSAINTARSSLSSFISIDNKPVGEHPLVVRYFKGVFNLRPTIPKTTTTWNPDTVLTFLKTLSPNRKLTFKKLTFKCVTLLWLLSGQRGQSIQLIDVRNISSDKNKLVISFGDLLKTTRPGFQQKAITLKAYAPDRRICIVRCMDEYLKRRNLLVQDKHTQLFVSFTQPHEPVTTSTISRWVKIIMKSAGLDIEKFTPHSIRAASTSAAKRNNVPLNSILTTAGWSRESTFRRYYDKPLTNKTYVLQK